MFHVSYIHIDMLSVDEILKWPTNFSGLSFNVEMAPSCLKYMNSVSCKGQYLLLPIAGYAADIQLAQRYLREAIDHLHSLHL